MSGKQILVVDDEAGIRELLFEILNEEGYSVRLADDAGSAREARLVQRPDLVLLDIWMPDSDGITLLKEWASSGQLTMPVVMMSGHGTIDTAVEATRIGAFDFLEKPIALQKLLATVGRALARNDAPIKANIDLSCLGRSALVVEFSKRLERIAAHRMPLLLLEESGAGAELCARFLHRPNTPWVAPDDTAWLSLNPIDVLSGARDGVLFVADAGRLSKLEQKGLLLILSKVDKHNVQLVVSAQRDLRDLVTTGSFDATLFQAMSSLALTVPSLHERPEDIPALASSMLAQFVESAAVPLKHFSTAALNVLRNENWPGNLKQLENVVKTAALTALDEEITREDVERALQPYAVTQTANNAAPPLTFDVSLREARDAFERAYFEHQIVLAKGNMTRVAERSGLERTHLYRKLKQLGIRVSKKTDAGPAEP